MNYPMKIVINECYCDMFDISDKAKDLLRYKYGIIFHPEYTPRDDPALVKVIEELQNDSAIIVLDSNNNITYLSKPKVICISDSNYDIISNYGYEYVIYNNFKKRKNINILENTKTKKSCI